MRSQKQIFNRFISSFNFSAPLSTASLKLEDDLATSLKNADCSITFFKEKDAS